MTTILPFACLLSLVSATLGYEAHSNWAYLKPANKAWLIHWNATDGEEQYDLHDDEYTNSLVSYGAKRGIEKPECYFEEFTGACCVRAGIHGHNIRTCIEVSIQLSNMQASVVVHVNDKEVLSKSVEKGKLCTNLPPPLPPTKLCLNTYYGVASWSEKRIDTCGALELANLVHIRFDCLRFADGKFQHHAEVQPEKYGLVNVYWQNGKPQFQIVSQPIPENVKQWIRDQWTKIRNVFRQKSRNFIGWLTRK